MEAIDLYKEETTKMEEQGGGREKVNPIIIFAFWLMLFGEISLQLDTCIKRKTRIAVGNIPKDTLTGEFWFQTQWVEIFFR